MCHVYNKSNVFLLVFLVLFFSGNRAYAQSSEEQPPALKRILFLLDASGSMNGEWGEHTKFELAKDILTNLADSIQQLDQSIEVGIRIFGHQYHKSLNACDDSKLEVDFTHQPMPILDDVLSGIEPQGQTPITYSLYLSIHDFTSHQENAIQSIILITDGLENCGGDPCEAAELLKKERITINPFIVGLDIADSLHAQFECIGTFLDAKDETTFKDVLSHAVNKSVSNTTTEINLWSGEKKLTDIPVTFYDHYSGEIRYHFIHTFPNRGETDTLYIDPQGSYDIRAHTYPPFTKINYRLRPGEHNTIDFQVGSGDIHFDQILNYDDKVNRLALMEVFAPKNVLSREVVDHAFISRKYTMYINTLPPIHQRGLFVEENQTNTISIPQNGRVLIENSEKIMVSLFHVEDERWTLLLSFDPLTGNHRMPVLPGEYVLLYIPYDTKEMEETKLKEFSVESGKTTVIQLP